MVCPPPDMRLLGPSGLKRRSIKFGSPKFSLLRQSPRATCPGWKSQSAISAITSYTTRRRPTSRAKRYESFLQSISPNGESSGEERRLVAHAHSHQPELTCRISPGRLTNQHPCGRSLRATALSEATDEARKFSVN